jgi:hypothetical protein
MGDHKKISFVLIFGLVGLCIAFMFSTSYTYNVGQYMSQHAEELQTKITGDFLQGFGVLSAILSGLFGIAAVLFSIFKVIMYFEE